MTALPVRAILRRPLAVASLAYLGLVAAAAIGAGMVAPYDPAATDLGHVLSGPTGLHPLGTDDLGRDLLSRIMHGGRVSLAGVAQAVLTVLLVGLPAGLVAGFLGGWVDRVVAWVIDLMLAIPVIITLLVTLAVFGNHQTAAMVALGVLGAPGLARVVRGATLAVREELYIAAARVAGLPERLIMVRHVLPRVAGPAIVQTSIFAGVALLVDTGLGYLGLGVAPPTPTWGGLVAEASRVIDRQPWMLVPTGGVIALAILSFGLLGDAVRDAGADRVAGRPTARPRRTARPTPRPAGRPEPGRPAGDPAGPGPRALLSVRGLTIALPWRDRARTVVEDFDLDIHPGETVGLMGESGCGKTITGRAVLGLLPAGGQVSSGEIWFDGTDLATVPRRRLRRLRGSQIALISQDPVASLDPAFTVGHQVAEFVRRHRRTSRAQARAQTLELLARVNLPDPAAVARRYPHQLSGGMAQRVAIAIALAGQPKLLIADEPTTALDVTVQAEILDLLVDLQQTTGMSILLISHDWGVVAGICQRAYVMYAGHLMETAPVTDLFARPRHPYTAGLLASVPGAARPGERLPAIPGTVPEPGERPAGCRFHPRCPLATAQCAAAPVPVVRVADGHASRCLHHDQVQRGGEHGLPTAAARRP